MLNCVSVKWLPSAVRAPVSLARLVSLATVASVISRLAQTQVAVGNSAASSAASLAAACALEAAPMRPVKCCVTVPCS